LSVVDGDVCFVETHLAELAPKTPRSTLPDLLVIDASELFTFVLQTVDLFGKTLAILFVLGSVSYNRSQLLNSDMD